MTIAFDPIGVIHTPFDEPGDMPRNAREAAGIRATVEVFPKYRAGLKDLDGFSHVILLFHFHRSSGYELEVVPRADTANRGVFATRSPRRPNPIGLSIMRLERVDGDILHVLEPDVIDGTPLLDIKPYVPAADERTEVRIGWLEHVDRSALEPKSDR